MRGQVSDPAVSRGSWKPWAASILFLTRRGLHPLPSHGSPPWAVHLELQLPSCLWLHQENGGSPLPYPWQAFGKRLKVTAAKTEPGLVSVGLTWAYSC